MDTNDSIQYINLNNRWFFTDGERTLPVVRGGMSDIAPTTPPTDPPRDPATGQFVPANPPRFEQTAEPLVPPAPPVATGVPAVEVRDGVTFVNGQRVFTADDLNKARTEEKDKLYPRLEQTEQQVRALAEEKAAREKAEAEARAAAEEAERKRQEEEMSAKDLLAKKDQEWEQRWQALQEENAAKDALLAKERQFNEIEKYKSTQLLQAAENILPELIDEVGGNSPEEVDASIARLTAKSASIIQNMSQAMGAPPAGVPVAQQRGPSVTTPPVGPMENQMAHQTLTPEQINNMTMEEYAQHRQQLLGGLTSQVQERGLYG